MGNFSEVKAISVVLMIVTIPPLCGKRMDKAGKFMHFLVGMKTDIQSRRLLESATGSELGRVTLAGTIRNSTGLPGRQMRVLGSYAIVYLLNGGGRYEDARGCRKEVRAGDMILLFPELAHHYGPPPGGRCELTQMK
jgi:hypothetical protein